MTSTKTVRPGTAAVPQVVKQLLGLVAQLEQTFQDRRFTRDDAYGMVMLPTEVQPQIDAAATAKQSPLRR